jgi:hypothetical protein
MSKGENSRLAMAGRESLAGSPSCIVSIPLIIGAEVDVSSGTSTISSRGNAVSRAGPEALLLIGHSSPIVCGVAGMMLKVGIYSSPSTYAFGVLSPPISNLPGAQGVSNRLEILGGRVARFSPPLNSPSGLARRSDVGRYGLGGGGARECIDDTYAAGGVVT